MYTRQQPQQLLARTDNLNKLKVQTDRVISLLEYEISALAYNTNSDALTNVIAMCAACRRKCA